MANQVVGIYLGATPAALDGAKALKAPVLIGPVGAAYGATLDLTGDANVAAIRFIQAVYLDLADVPAAGTVTLIHRATGFRVRVKGGTQGWFPMAINAEMVFDIVTNSTVNGLILPLWFANVAAPNFQWVAA